MQDRLGMEFADLSLSTQVVIILFVLSVCRIAYKILCAIIKKFFGLVLSVFPAGKKGKAEATASSEEATPRCWLRLHFKVENLNGAQYMFSRISLS